MIHVIDTIAFIVCLVVAALFTLAVFNVYERMIEHPFIGVIHGWVISGLIIYEFPKLWLTILVLDILAARVVAKKEPNATNS